MFDLTTNPHYIRIVAAIDKEVDYVDIKSYSHTIISLHLQEAAEKFGKEAANNLIDEFELERLGWQKSPVDLDRDEVDPE